MIKNQKQVKITEGKLAELLKAKSDFEKNKDDIAELEYSLGINSFNALISQLEDDLSQYKSLTEGDLHCLKASSLQNIPEVLIMARLAQKMSQRELADLLGIKEQQIQRYEATDYGKASWLRIVEVGSALNLSFDFQNVVIYNSQFEDSEFDYPEGVTSQQIKEANEKLKKNNSLFFA